MIEVSLTAPVLRLSINRPEKKNALDNEHYRELTKQLIQADLNPDVLVIWLQGAGGDFTAGNDIKDFLKSPPTGPESPVLQFMTALRELKKPLVVMLEGAVVGIGCSMLLHADLVYASKTAVFQMPFVNLGLVPEFGLSYLLPRLVGPLKAKELLLLGRPFGADEALSYGLVNQVFDPQNLEKETQDRVNALAAQPAEAVWLAKKLISQAQEPQLSEAIGREILVFKQRLQSPEALKAFQQFLG